LTKIALIGSAPSSVALAPYADPSWKIWSCSPGARPYLKRVDAHFEIHLWEPDQAWFSPDYIKFMAELPCPVYMLEHIPAIPGSIPYPKREIMEHYGDGAVYFYTSSLSWMFALALAQPDVTEIGLWGVDMSAAEEVYTHQRAGCHYWIGRARDMGIKVTVPPQSDLAMPPPLYGFCEQDRMHQKLLARKAEIEHRLNVARVNAANAEREAVYLQGALEDVNYVRQTFVNDRLSMDMSGMALPISTLPIPDPVLDEAARSEIIADFTPKTLDHLADLRADDAPAGGSIWASTPAPEFINGHGA
jgi:hypothetical protein